MKTYKIKNKDGKDLNIFVISNENGFSVEVCEMGASLWKFVYPDGTDVIVGQKEKYDIDTNSHFGSVCGRVAGRISNSKFIMNDKEYKLLSEENSLHHLHGGPKGFSRQKWSGRFVEDKKNTIEMIYNSADGEAGYPANLKVVVSYVLTDDNELIMDTEGIPDNKTIVNLTNHVYWNLNGESKKLETIFNHELMLCASSYYEAEEETTLPTGNVLDVLNTSFDFRTPKTIGKDIQSKECKAFGGYDHIFKIDGVQPRVHADVENLHLVARVCNNQKHEKTMEVWTTSPAVVLYTANKLNWALHGAFCLETQFPADCPNWHNFPDIFVSTHETWRQRTVWKFS